MPPLHRALALAQIQAVAMLIRHHLDLDMPRPLDQLLQIDLARAEAALRLAAGRRIRRSQLLRRRPPRACPCRRRRPRPSASPDSQSPPPPAAPPQPTPSPVTLPGTRGIPAASAACRALRLRPQRPHGARRRPDERHARRRAGLGKLRILRQEPIPGMHGIRPGPPRHIENQIAAQIALRRRRRAQPVRLVRMKHMQRRAVGIGVDRHRPQPHLAARANHPQRNLAAIRNQHFFYGPSQAAILPTRGACQAHKHSLTTKEEPPRRGGSSD